MTFPACETPMSTTPYRLNTLLRALLMGGVLTHLHTGMAQTSPAAPDTLNTVTIIGTTPLPGTGLSKQQIAAPVQTATGDQINDSRALDLTDFINQRLGSVYINETQGNAYQPDVNYRGYTASPVLGTAQGLSVYMDGVRMNQPFGDVMSWDLVPRSAIGGLTLVPGSNPLFGLNTLGGALAIETKDGLAWPGTSVQMTYGSHAQRNIEVEHGGSNDKGLHWYLTSNLARDSGWRDDSPSDVKQLFGKLGWQDGGSQLNLTLSHAHNALQGNGLQEQRMLDKDWRSVYTKPDTTENRSTLLNLSGQRELVGGAVLSGNAYYRRIRTSTVNGDINEGSLDQSVYQPNAAEQAALTTAVYIGFPTCGANDSNTPFPSWRCIAQALLNDEPGEKCNGLINRSNTRQSNYGLSGQMTWRDPLAGYPNQFTLGAAYDISHVSFDQSTQLGYLNPDRSVTGVNAYADGVTGGNVDGEPLDNRVNLSGRTRVASLYATNTVTLDGRWHLTTSGRYDHSVVRNTDHINPSGASSLSGEHHFGRLNPALGLTFAPSKTLTAYAGYNQGSRAPSTIELGCANPDQPCKLPNAMAGDPPLKQVVTQTFEAGLRGKAAGDLEWSAGVFRADNRNDIQFVADDQSGYGYFKNFGKTRRQGIELGLSGKSSRLSWSANLTLQDATYQSGETFNGSGNSSNSSAAAGSPGVDGTITVRPGNHIPLVPQQILKLNAAYRVSGNLSLGATLISQGSMYARGNENNAHQADGVYYLGSGKTQAFTVLNVSATYLPTPQLELFVKVNNLLDTRYTTSAQLGPTGFDANGNFVARPFGKVGSDYPVRHATFYAPGAERAVLLGVKYYFDKPSR